MTTRTITTYLFIIIFIAAATVPAGPPDSTDDAVTPCIATAGIVATMGPPAALPAGTYSLLNPRQAQRPPQKIGKLNKAAIA
jgi:peptidoglycan/LPS O-acetylase OafA/YrhL